jgi:hypothetical protein
MAGVPDQDRVVAVAGIRQPGDRCCTFSYPDYVDYRDKNSVLDGIVGGELIAPAFGGGGKAERVIGQIVTGNYFEVLHVNAQLGRTFLAGKDRVAMAAAVVVISGGFWRRRFGADPHVIGRTITLNRYPFTIVGITPPPFIGTFVGYSLDLWTPSAMEQVFFPGGDDRGDRTHTCLEGYARLKPGVTRDQAQANLDLISRQIQTQFPDTSRLRPEHVSALENAVRRPAARLARARCRGRRRGPRAPHRMRECRGAAVDHTQGIVRGGRTRRLRVDTWPTGSCAGGSGVRAALEGFLTAFDNLDWPQFIASFEDEATVCYPSPPNPSSCAEGRAQFEPAAVHGPEA